MQVSIDIETVGKAPYGRIVQIGVVAFEMDRGPFEPIEILEAKDRWLDLIVAPYTWGVDDPDVIRWWQQPEQRAAAEAINAGTAVSIESALDQVADFIKKFLGNNAGIWAKPPGFDLVELRSAYAFTGRPCPWSMAQESCIRTAAWLAAKVPRNKFRAPSMKGKGMVKHYGLHDAVVQAVLAKAAWRALIEANNERRA